MTPRSAAESPAVGSRLRRLPLPVLLGLMLIGGLCALLALNTASAAQELKQRSLTDSNAATSDLEQQLLRDLAAKQAPAALAAAARAQGLVPNPNPAFLRINADGSVTVLGSPTPATVPPPPVTPTPSAAASPSTTKKPAATPSGTAGKPTGSKQASSRAAAPVVTVTVTRPAPTPSSSPSTSKAPGGH